MNRIPFPVLAMKGISKKFGPTIALDNVNFEINRGEVHALLGENGAGKSTLVKILSGALKSDKGQIFVNNKSFSPSSPMDSRLQGISMIYQELNLAPHLTVEENIMLGKEIANMGVLKRKKMREKVSQALETLRHPDIKLDTLVGELGMGARQIIEIARALVDQSHILIMDEPTSSLSQEDSDRLFEVIKTLKNQGVSIIYISHFLEEVQKVADRFTVLRDGKSTGSGSLEETTLEEIIKMMVGKNIEEMFPRVTHEVGKSILHLKAFQGKCMKEPINLSLQKGEILGIAGLIGAGRTEMLRSLFGLEKECGGSLSIHGEEQKKKSSLESYWTKNRAFK